MAKVQIATKEERTAFLPGQTLEGGAFWDVDPAPQSAEIRLFWYTKGKGTQDVQIVATQRFDQLQPREARPFQFDLPLAPYSFSGKLISLIWGLELVLEPSQETARFEFTLSPTGEEIVLG